MGMNKNASVTETGDDDEQQVERPRRRRGRNESYIRGAMRGGGARRSQSPKLRLADGSVNRLRTARLASRRAFLREPFID